MNKKRMKLIMITSIYLLILLTITSTFAWFFVNKELEIDYGSEIVCEAGTSLEISMLEDVNEETNEETWSKYSSYIKYTGVVPKLEDITGDGKTLYRPTSLVTNQETGELTPEGLDTAKVINSDGYGDYIEIHFKLRTTSVMNVYLSGDSVIAPITTSDTDRNAFGNFSKDFIAGALRVAVLEKLEDGTEELRMICAPQPFVQLKYDSEKSIYSLDPNGTIETYYYYKYDETVGQIVKYEVTQDDFASKLFVLGSTRTTEAMVNNSPILTVLEPPLEEIVEKRMVVRLWFEGTDREASQALSGGQIKMNLKFMGMTQKEETPEENKKIIDSIVFGRENGHLILENATSDVYFSVDGYSWYSYSISNFDIVRQYIAHHSKDFKIYIKYPETPLYYEYMSYLTYSYGGSNNESS